MCLSGPGTQNRIPKYQVMSKQMPTFWEICFTQMEVQQSRFLTLSSASVSSTTLIQYVMYKPVIMETAVAV